MKVAYLQIILVVFVCVVMEQPYVRAAESREGEVRQSSSFRNWLDRDRKEMKAWRERQRVRTPVSVERTREEVQPGFSSSPQKWAVAGMNFVYQPTVEPSGAYDFKLLKGPAAMQMATNTGELVWLPTLDDVGEVSVELEAEGGGQTNRQAFTIDVTRFVEAGKGAVSTNGGTFVEGDFSLSAAAGEVSRNIDVAVYTLENEVPEDIAPGAKRIGPVRSIQFKAADGGTLSKNDLKGLKATFEYDTSLLPEGVKPEQVKLVGFDPANPGQYIPIETRKSASRIGLKAGLAIGAVAIPPMIVILWEVHEAVVQELGYTEVFDDNYTQVFYRDSILNDSSAARAYGVEIAKAISKARDAGKALEFEVPGSVEVMVTTSSGKETAQYVSFNELIYVKPGCSGIDLALPVAHEYFHDIQDGYYLMGAAGAASMFSATSDVYWWNEATAMWFASHVFPAAAKDYIAGAISVGGGYLRLPLASTIQAAAYSKATFIEYAVSQKPKFVVDVMNKSSGATRVMTAINEVFPLKDHYKHYVNWALGAYGPGRSLDSTILLEEPRTAMKAWDAYNSSGQALSHPVKIVTIGNESNVVEEVFQDSREANPYVAFVHRLSGEDLNDPARNAKGKAVDVKFERTGGLASDEPYILLHGKGNPGEMKVYKLAPGGDWQRFHDIGQDALDVNDALYMVYADTSLSGSGNYKWHVQIRDLDRLAGPWKGGEGLRLTELKINGQSYLNYDSFSGWAKQWIREELKEGQDDDENEGLVTSLMDGLMSGISAEIMLYIIPAVKAAFDGVPFALAMETSAGANYLPYLPGMPEEKMQALRDDKNRPPLKRTDDRALSGKWTFGEEDEMSGTLEWALSVDKDPGVLNCSLKLKAEGIEGDSDGENAIRSMEASAEGKLMYQDLPHGQVASDQTYYSEVRAAFMQRLMAMKIQTDAEFKPLVEQLTSSGDNDD